MMNGLDAQGGGHQPMRVWAVEYAVHCTPAKISCPSSEELKPQPFLCIAGGEQHVKLVVLVRLRFFFRVSGPVKPILIER